MITSSHDALRDLPLLQLLPPDVKELVIDSFVPASFTFGATIVREGEDADAFYVLVSGRARVVTTGENGEEVTLSVLRAIDSFGEMALLERTVRRATVRASGDVDVLRLDRSVFDALLRVRPEIRGYFELQIKHRHLGNFLRQYTPFATLAPEALQLMVRELETREAVAGETVIHEGDPPGSMYVVEEGHLRVYTEEQGVGRRHYLAYLRKGDFFGELSLFKNMPRSASVEAISPCRLLALTPKVFEALIATYPDFRQSLEQRVEQYDYRRVARVPLDFEREILPSETSVFEKVGPDQIDQTVEFRVFQPDGNGASDSAAPARSNGAAGNGAAPSPFATGDGRFVKRPKRIRRFRHVRQVDEMDCGAASLAMICRHFGKSVSLSRIRQLVHTSLDGTSLRAIVRGATELGLAARAVKTDIENVHQMPLPAIVHWEGNHWVVLYDVGPTHAKVADPGSGLVRLPLDELGRKWSGYAALFDYTEDFRQEPEAEKSQFAWLWPFFRPFRRLIAQAFALAVIVAVLEMVIPVFTQVIVDRVLVNRDIALLNVMVIAMLGVLVFVMLASVVQRYLLSFISVRVDSGTLDFMTRRLLSLPMSYFNTRRTGDIQRRLSGLRDVRKFIVQDGVASITDLALLATALTIMMVYSPWLTLVFLAVTPAYAILMFLNRHWLRPIYDKLEEAHGRYQSYQVDAIRGIETVKAMGAEGSFRELMLNEFNALTRQRFRADFTMMTYDSALNVITFMSVALFLWIGARQVMQGQLTIGGLVAFNSLVGLANRPILRLLSHWDVFQYVAILLNRLDDVFEAEPEQGADRSRLIPVRTLEGRISLRNLGFRYGGPESPPILDGITFDVPPNKMVAIVGRSGSGKTTLIKCLAGLLEPTDGSIVFDGVDLKSLNYHDLRRNIGFVLQENHLFNDTIARNIAFGEEEPDMDAVMWAARVANAHEFIERLPLGYETKIGESGLALSGGQRQRVAIARSLYHQPPVMIFDEATSALDTESERAVKENMDRLLEGRTSFVIAHRLSTVQHADVIIVLERGRLVEHGSHEELMARQGLYYYLCSQQLGI
ncbi:MAG: peptidase domain-containing ABC transporter [Gemmatimonadota bacterium]|nr:peptidase domain-containing ABC transporter [Gemmatimonadota bacterium]